MDFPLITLTFKLESPAWLPGLMIYKLWLCEIGVKANKMIKQWYSLSRSSSLHTTVKSKLFNYWMFNRFVTLQLKHLIMGLINQSLTDQSWWFHPQSLFFRLYLNQTSACKQKVAEPSHTALFHWPCGSAEQKGHNNLWFVCNNSSTGLWDQCLPENKLLLIWNEILI